MHIGLTQEDTGCSDSASELGKQLVDSAPVAEAEAELIEIRLKLGTTAMLSTQEEGFEIADRLVQPLQVAAYCIKRFPMAKFTPVKPVFQS